MQITKTFSDKGLSNKLLLRNGESFTYTADLSLNFSGSAATIDATSTIDVTGTIEVVGILLGDD